jgi:hypothetical protein
MKAHAMVADLLGVLSLGMLAVLTAAFVASMTVV